MDEDQTQPKRDEGSVEKSASSGSLPPEARLRYAFLIAVLVVSGSVSNILLEYAFGQIQFPRLESPLDIVRMIGDLLSNPWMDLGISLMIVQFISLIYAFRLGPFSLTIPLRGSGIYILTAVLAQFILDEKVTLMRWVAIAVILVGIFFIGISERKG